MKKSYFNRRRQSVIFLLGLSAMSFISCEKVVDIDLNSAAPRVVIEGHISDGSEPASIRISRSVNFDESNSFPPVAGATVTLSDDVGNMELLMESVAGTYTASTITGIPGRTYTLSVRVDNTIYEAKSLMPHPVEIDSFTVENEPFHGAKIISIHFKDTPRISNYYRLVEILNGVQQAFIFLHEDRALDGKIITSTLLARDNKLNTGDSVIVRLECIDESVYQYFRTASQIAGQGSEQTVSPANPRTNLSGGTLGYFSAYAARSKSIIVP